MDGETGETDFIFFGGSGVEIQLGATPIRPDGTFLSDSVTLRNPQLEAAVGGITDAGRTSSWGGRFSNVLDEDGEPRLAAGTFGGHARAVGGSESSFLGGFIASKP